MSGKCGSSRYWIPVRSNAHLAFSQKWLSGMVISWGSETIAGCYTIPGSSFPSTPAAELTCLPNLFHKLGREKRTSRQKLQTATQHGSGGGPTARGVHWHPAPDLHDDAARNGHGCRSSPNRRHYHARELRNHHQPAWQETGLGANPCGVRAHRPHGWDAYKAGDEPLIRGSGERALDPHKPPPRPFPST